jgi:hypothetical protein
MPTVARILELAPTCCRLADDHKFKSELFRKVAKSSSNQAVLIYVYWKILNEIYERDNTYELQAPANYLWELCQKWAFKAASIVDGGIGGQVTPVTPGGIPARIEFYVSASSFIADGASSVQLPLTWSGYGVEVDRGNVPQSTLSTEPSYFNYDSATRTLTISPAAVLGELIAIIPL